MPAYQKNSFNEGYSTPYLNKPGISFNETDSQAYLPSLPRSPHIDHNLEHVQEGEDILEYIDNIADNLSQMEPVDNNNPHIAFFS